MNYYNDSSKYAASWLRNLVEMGDLPPGFVDDRPIAQTTYSDLSPFTQCHFFAGIGGWALALRLSGWPDDIPVWTGSCPCQPFSVSSTDRKLTADDRHLWPNWRDLIAKYQPPTIFGEQVSSVDGRIWLDDVRTDLQALGYEFAAADLCAASFGFGHVRQRLYWVAHSHSKRLEGLIPERSRIRSNPLAPTAERSLSRIPPDIPRPRDPELISMFNGLPRPMAVVRAFGNAIVPQVAACFISWFMETIGEHSRPTRTRNMARMGVS